jgi:DNA-binding MarR family transcriptional regulator
MNYGELLSSFLVDLQSLFRKNITIEGTTFPQLLAISVIPDNGIEMSTLSDRLGIDNSTCTRLVAGMEGNGWVERRPYERDRRIIQVFLTVVGDQLQADLEIQLDKLGSTIERDIDPLDRNEIIENISSLHWVLSKLTLKNKKIV